MAKDRQVERSKKALRDAFVELCQEMPLEAITVKILTDRADYSRPTFYKHYENIRDFEYSILREETEALIDIHMEQMKKFGNQGNIDNVSARMEVMFHHVYTNRDLYKLFFFNESFWNPTDVIGQMILSCYRTVYEIDADPADKDFVQYMMISNMIYLLKYWIQCDFRQSPHYIAELYTRYCVQPDFQVRFIGKKKDSARKFVERE